MTPEQVPDELAEAGGRAIHGAQRTSTAWINLDEDSRGWFTSLAREGLAVALPIFEGWALHDAADSMPTSFSRGDTPSAWLLRYAAEQKKARS